MKTDNKNILNRRVLKMNVGFLLSDGPGNIHESHINIPSPVKVADDLIVNHISGPIRLTRAKEGILVQAEITMGVSLECPRCLDAFDNDIVIDVEELYMHPTPTDTEFGVGADGKLDLAPLLRAELLISTSHKLLCRPDCKGLCQQCGTNHNHATCDCEIDNIDPRMAKLKELLDATSDSN